MTAKTKQRKKERITKGLLIVRDITECLNKQPMKYIRVNTLAKDTGYNWRTIKSWLRLLTQYKVLDCQKLNNWEVYDEEIDK